MEKSLPTIYMSKSTLYRQAKELAKELNVEFKIKYVGVTKATLVNFINDLELKKAQDKTLLQQILETELVPIAQERLEASILRQNFFRNVLQTELLEAVKARERRVAKDLIKKLLREKKWNEILKLALTDNNYLLTEKQAEKMFNQIIAEDYYVLKLFNGERYQYYALSNNTADIFISMLTTGGDFRLQETYGSDVWEAYDFTRIDTVSIEPWKNVDHIIKNKSGMFFRYTNTTNIDLSRYQIFNEEQASNKKLISRREHCIIHALLKAGIPRALTNAVKLAIVTSSHLAKKSLKKVAQIINTNIRLYFYDSKQKKQRYTNYKCKDATKTINLAIFEEHFFVFEQTKYSRQSIKKYDLLYKMDDFNEIITYNEKTKKIIYGDDKKINSLGLVREFFDQGKFVALDMSLYAEASRDVTLKNHIYLNNIKNEQQPCVYKCNERKTPPVWYADTETYVNGDYHKLQLFGVVSNNSDLVHIMNVNDPRYRHPEVSKEQMLVNKFLNLVTNNGKSDAQVYFHNLKYDYHVIESYICIKEKCEKDNQIYSVSVKYKGKKVELRDSFKLLSMPLSKFQKTFKLPKEFGKKEAICYEYYTPNNDNQRINCNIYRNMLSFDNRKVFDENMLTEPSYDEKTNTFNPMDYYKEYLRLDCLVLKKGLLKFDELINLITEGRLSIFECLTISSLTDRYMNIMGAYNDVYEVKSNLREYISKAVYGGRVCVNKKYIKQTITGKIADYDGVSLYPSAINRLCRERGLPKGPAVRFGKDISVYDWKEVTYAIMTVRIIKVNKFQQMPFIAHKSDSSIKYVNEAPPEPIIIDSTTLEDYIKFHRIEYEILDGVYWNQGVNKTMGLIIQKLFNERLKHKEEGNKAMSNTLKLMLNSAYGKTILKKTKKEKVIIEASRKTYNKDKKEWVSEENKRFKAYVFNNWNTISSFRKLNDWNWEVEKNASDDSYNRGHIGCSILSTSKRIMNELFGVANDIGCPIYYTDTDSLHCNLEDIPAIENTFYKAYKKVLTGKELEQFHVDFDLANAASEIYAIKSIFLGKKSYIDMLESKDKNGNTINGFHIRLKGITEDGLEYAAKQYSEDKKTPNYWGLFADLAKGTKKEIILNPFNVEENKSKVLFEFKHGKVSTRKEFVRKVQF